MEENSKEKIYKVLKSLFRFDQMIEKSVPSVLLEMERAILSDRMKELTPDEFYLIVTSWEGFKDDEIISNEIEDKACARDLKEFFHTLN